MERALSITSSHKLLNVPALCNVYVKLAQNFHRILYIFNKINIVVKLLFMHMSVINYNVKEKILQPSSDLYGPTVNQHVQNGKTFRQSVYSWKSCVVYKLNLFNNGKVGDTKLNRNRIHTNATMLCTVQTSRKVNVHFVQSVVCTQIMC